MLHLAFFFKNLIDSGKPSRFSTRLFVNSNSFFLASSVRVSAVSSWRVFSIEVSNSAISFFTAAGFLAYGNNLSIVRAVGSSAKNASGGTAVLVDNSDTFQYSYLNNNNSNTYGAFVARYAGSLGNSLEVQVCDNATDFATWDYKSYFTSAPGTSEFVSNAGGAQDEMHIVVIDQDGLFTGVANTVLETFAFVSKASDASSNGQSNYYKQVVFNSSRYVYAIDPVSYSSTHSTWGGLASTAFTQLSGVQNVVLASGVDATPSEANLTGAYDLFVNKEVIDISLIVTGDASAKIGRAHV